MGPIIILDKSTFQALSRREHLQLHFYFLENLTPILGLELLGDLRKERRGSKTAEEKVAELAEKFGGSGPATNVDYRTLCANSLLGNHFPLDGRILPQGGRPVRSRDGTRGFFIDLSPFNRAILRWADGEFEDFEREFAGYWRQVTRNLEVDSFIAQLNAQHVILPKVESVAELQQQVDGLLSTVTLQNTWLTWLLSQLAVPRDYERVIWARWRAHPATFLQEFSPYSWHCLRVILMLVTATRHRLLRWNSTNLLDTQYLYYLPFCMVFVSDDHVHQMLAPLLIRPDQSFAVGRELKADLRRLGEYRDALSDRQRQMLGFALGSHPPPMRDSVVCALWKRHCVPWRPGRGNLASRLPEPEREEATRWVENMFREVEGDAYFARPRVSNREDR